jgi:hypothetical protein
LNQQFGAVCHQLVLPLGFDDFPSRMGVVADDLGGVLPEMGDLSLE